MTVQARDRAAERKGGVPISLGIVAVLMFLAAASLAGLALAGSGGPLSITFASIGALAMALFLAASGVQAVRRRTFWFAVLVPAALAVFNLGYALYSGTYEAFWTVAMFGAAAFLVVQSREDFE